MTPEELAAIRDRVDGYPGAYTQEEDTADIDRRDLLAHLDAITEAVGALHFEPHTTTERHWMVKIRPAVLAILNQETTK